MTESKPKREMSEFDKAALKAYLAEQTPAPPRIDWVCLVVWSIGIALGVVSWALILGLVFASLVR